MKFALFAASLAATACLGLSGCGGPTKVAEDDLPKLQGEWVVVEYNENGKAADAQRLDHLSVSINGAQFNKVEANGPKLVNAEFESIRLDTTKTPREIEFLGTRGADQGKSKAGIYAFEDDKLKICSADFGAPRPTEFAGKAKTILMVMKRKNPLPPGQ